MRNVWAGAAIIVLAALFLLGGLWGLAYWIHGGNVQSEVGLPVLAIAGVIPLLLALGLVSVAFSIFDLDDKSQALALPEGSVRAVIALSLVVLFAILTIFTIRKLVGVRQQLWHLALPCQLSIKALKT
jgi:hypothetical protein